MSTNLKKRIAAFSMVITMIVSLFSTFTPAYEASAAVAASSLKINNAHRDDYTTVLSNQALDYYTGSYAYDVLDNLTGTELYNALHALMKDTMTDSVSYSSLPSYWDYTDAEDGEFGATLFYCDQDKSTLDGSGDILNREHVWPKSNASFYELGGGCDIHHLRPADSTINSKRSNDPYGNVEHTKANEVIYKGTGTLAGYSAGGYFEPLDNVKGDAARIILYVYTRWQQPNLFISGVKNPNLDPDDSKNDGNKLIADLATLLEWNYEDPVDAWEMQRNDLCQDIQGNRNVFIDYPELAWLMFGLEVPEGLVSPCDATPDTVPSQYDTSVVKNYIVPEITEFDSAVSKAEYTIDSPYYTIENGNYVLLSTNFDLAVSVNAKSTYYRVGTAYTIGDQPSADIVWEVNCADDGTVTFTNSGSKLAVNTSKDNCTLDTTNIADSVYTTWKLKCDDEGNFFIESAKKDNKFIYWGSNYSDFSTNSYDGSTYKYAFQLVRIDETGAHAVTGTEVDESELTPTPTPAVVERDNTTVADGNYAIYNPVAKMALSTNPSYEGSYYNGGVAYTLKADGTLSNVAASETWKLVNNADGTVTIYNGNDKLSMEAEHSSTPMNKANDVWQLVKGDTAGTVLIKNVARDVYLEWYGGQRFSGYEIDEENIRFFEMKLIPVDTAVVTPVVSPTPSTSPKPTGTIKPTTAPADGNAFVPVTSADDLTDGKYMVVAKSDDAVKAMRKDSTKEDGSLGTNSGRGAITVSVNEDGTIATSDTALVWKLALTESGWTIQDEDNLYLSMSVASNACFSSKVNKSELGENGYYTIAVNEDGTFVITNEKNGRSISPQINSAKEIVDFRGYLSTSSSYHPVSLYKLVEAPVVTPEPTVTETPVVSPEPTPANELADGKYVVYNAPAMKAMSSDAVSTYYRAAADCSAEEDGSIRVSDNKLIWTVSHAEGEDGQEVIVLIADNGQNLSVTTGKNNATLGEESDKWIITKNDNGSFYVQNVATEKYLEWYEKYKEFSTFTAATLTEIYEISFAKAVYVEPTVTETPGVTPEPTVTETPGVTPEPTVTEAPAAENMVFAPVSSAEDIAAGNYMVVAKSDDAVKAMRKDSTKEDGSLGTNSGRGAITVSVNEDGTIATSDTALVWKLALTESGWTIQDEDNLYLSMSAASNACFSSKVNKSELGENGYYTIAVNEDGTFVITNEKNGRSISPQINSAKEIVDFRGYLSTSSSYHPVNLYKLVEAPVVTPEPTVTETPVVSPEPTQPAKPTTCDKYGHKLVYKDGVVCSRCGENVVYSGYVATEDGKKIFVAESVPANGIVAVGGSEYFFENGYKQTGWKTVNGNVYYFCTLTGAMTRGTAIVDGVVYDFNKDGTLTTLGTKVTIDGVKFYFAGQMQTGWVSKDGATYYCRENGSVVLGWQEIGGSIYYFGVDGKMATGTRNILGVDYVFGADGKHTVGTWKSCVLGTQYYFAGKFVTGLQVINGDTYYFDSLGYRAENKTIVLNNVVYTFGSDGRMVESVNLSSYTGFITIDVRTYYYENGTKVTGKKRINGKTYVFANDGTLILVMPF